MMGICHMTGARANIITVVIMTRRLEPLLMNGTGYTTRRQGVRWIKPLKETIPTSVENLIEMENEGPYSLVGKPMYDGDIPGTYGRQSHSSGSINQKETKIA